MLGEDRVTKFVIEEIVSSATAQYVKKVNYHQLSLQLLLEGKKKKNKVFYFLLISSIPGKSEREGQQNVHDSDSSRTQTVVYSRKRIWVQRYP